MKKKIFLVLAALLFISSIMMVGCSSEDESVSNERGVLRIGALPGGEDEYRRREQYQPFMELLERELDMDVELYLGSDFTATIEAMRANKVDIVSYGPLSYILAADIADAEAFALSSREDYGIFLESYIIVHEDSDIYEVSDLKGKTFAFVDPASTGGYLIPRLSMVENGIDPDADLASAVFVGNHDACAAAVINKNVDASTIVMSAYYNGIDEGRINPEEIRIINISDPFPAGPWAWRKSLDDTLKEDIKRIFFNMTDEEIALCQEVFARNHVGFEEAEDSFWDSLRKAAELIELDLKSSI
ncbi:phosphonate transport system substrate-binding protein [Natronincola peptidivorans]|uniref:Phosphonate transport system substrate-binding protein n=1 Tax=Natronincola peptidivorans TaxID=426128 RepID=A0A1I0A6G6_9FIRM|nr:phosphate/phosphite/phosphonate ABC transporter substrate-binding protein [Natronincola peptidivorans]SES89736.1 phosphonate transport system substrate-binding protein [Natronincola peptidivorans]